MYSFDVYDTLITRKVNEPKDIFRLIYNLIDSREEYHDLKSVLSLEFPMARVEAEKKARILKDSEISIEDIYDQLTVFYGLSRKE